MALRYDDWKELLDGAISEGAQVAIRTFHAPTVVPLRQSELPSSLHGWSSPARSPVGQIRLLRDGGDAGDGQIPSILLSPLTSEHGTN
jgi:hypothetical protein